MNRNTLLAIVLAVALIFGVYYIPNFLDKDKPNRTQKKEKSAQGAKEKNIVTAEKKEDKTKKHKDQSEKKQISAKPDNNKAVIEKNEAGLLVSPSEGYNYNFKEKIGIDKAKTFVVESDVFKINFSTIDASVANLQLKKYKDQDNKLIADAVWKKSEVPKQIEIISFENDILAKISDYKKKKLILSVYQKNQNKKSYVLSELLKAEERTGIADILKTVKYKINPLSTSFRSADGLKQKTQSVSDYSIYEYKPKEKLITIKDSGTLGDKAEQYKSMVKDNSEKLFKRYGYKYKDQSDLKIVLFTSKYNINSEKEKKQIEFIKIYTLHKEDYLIDLDIIIKKMFEGEGVLRSNDLDNPNASFYIQWGESIGPHYEEENKTSYDNALVTAYLNFKSQNETEEEEVEETKPKFSNFKWVGIDSRYLFLCLIPEWTINERGFKVWKKKNYFGEIINSEDIKKEHKEIIGVGFDRVDFLGKSEKPKTFHLTVFLGPKRRALLTNPRYEPFEVVNVRNRKWTSFLKPLEWAIEWLLFTFFDFAKNFGWAIVILTVVLKIVLHPLNKKSLDSTRKMQELGPKLKELEAKYKKNPQQKQKATMALYKKEGVNPLGGCLPMLLQMPFFFALWAVLPVLLDLKNANFLWISDLSSPDFVDAIVIPFFNVKLNILTVIMTLTSLVQMKVTPQPTTGVTDDKAQTAKMMQFMMPLVFLFVFWSMPSGLVLYWTVQNFLQIMQQFYINFMTKRKKNKGGK